MQNPFWVVVVVEESRRRVFLLIFTKPNEMDYNLFTYHSSANIKPRRIKT